MVLCPVSLQLGVHASVTHFQRWNAMSTRVPNWEVQKESCFSKWPPAAGTEVSPLALGAFPGNQCLRWPPGSCLTPSQVPQEEVVTLIYSLD